MLTSISQPLRQRTTLQLYPYWVSTSRNPLPSLLRTPNIPSSQRSTHLYPGSEMALPTLRFFFLAISVLLPILFATFLQCKTDIPIFGLVNLLLLPIDFVLLFYYISRLRDPRTPPPRAEQGISIRRIEAHQHYRIEDLGFYQIDVYALDSPFQLLSGERTETDRSRALGTWIASVRDEEH